MKANLHHLKKFSALLMAGMLTSSMVHATTFTAVANGNWGSTATWGGTTPSYNTTADHVVIPTGLTVTMDGNVTFSGALAQLNVAGTLTSASNISLSVNSAASVIGAGTISIGNAILGTTASLAFSGTLTADTLSNSALNLAVGASVTARKALILTSGALSLGTGGSLNMNVNSTIIVSGGTLALNGGSIGFSGAYNVTYTQASVVTGTELSGAGLTNVTINVPAADSVSLASNLTVNGTFYLQSGKLNLSGFNVTLNGNVNGAGTLSGNSTSNLTVNTTGGLTGSLNFATSGQKLNNFTLNVGSGNSVALSSTLSIAGTLTLTGGSKLDISGVMLTTAGNITGSGSLVVNANSGLTINRTGGITSDISFSGTSLGTLVINTGSVNSVTLGSDLTVSTLLNLQSGALVLNGHNLTVAGNVAAAGSGTISSSSASNITITSSTSPAGAIMFSAIQDTVNNLVVNLGSTSSVMIGSNLIVHGTLNFMSGNVNIGRNNITLASSGSISGASSTSYVITDSIGSLGMQLTAGNANATTFPIGTSVRYAPALVQLSSASSSGQVMVGVSGDVLAQGIIGSDLSATQSAVKNTWFVQSNIVTNLNLSLELMWSAAMEVNNFDRSLAYISHYTGGRWDTSTIAAATVQGNGMFSLKRSGITSLSPFAVFDKNTATGVPQMNATTIQFEVYPNPAVDCIVLKGTSDFTGTIYVDILNVTGQVVATQELNNGSPSITVSKLNSGVYFIRLYNDKMNVVQKFSKNIRTLEMSNKV